MSLFESIKLGAQGLAVQRQRMELIASNLANLSTTQTPEGGPYRRRQLVVEAIPKSEFAMALENAAEGAEHDELIHGARATEIKLDPSPPVMKYEPDHPHADARGYVAYPNINPAVEMVDMVSTTRSYQANLTSIRSAQGMINDAIEMLRSQ
jgi:flagellar basal-body rod protein FlgC